MLNRDLELMSDCKFNAKYISIASGINVGTIISIARKNKIETNEFPINMISALIDGHKGIDLDFVVSNFEQNLFDLFNSSTSGLTDREKLFIALLFKERQTLETIGQNNNLTRERVRQVIKSGMEKLRLYSNIQVLLYGKKIAEMQQSVIDLEKEIEYKKSFLTKVSEELDKELLKSNTVLETLTIYDVGFSRRAEHFLEKRNFKFVSEVAKLSKNDLLNLEGIGITTAENIIKIMNKLGYIMKKA